MRMPKLAINIDVDDLESGRDYARHSTLSASRRSRRRAPDDLISGQRSMSNGRFVR
jgi:hypothetical protein